MKGLRSKYFVGLLVSLVIIVAFLVVGLNIEAAEQTKTATKTEKKAATKEVTTPTSKTTFKWIPARAGATKAQVSIGRGVVCPFEFAIADPKIIKVKLSIKDEKVAKMGIVVADEEVAVTGGKAASSAMFSIVQGTRPGNYKVTIVAKDAATDKIIAEGVIPFQALPKGAGGC